MELVASASASRAIAEVVALRTNSWMCRTSCKGAPASALNNATSRSTMWKGRAGMVRRSMRGCESYSTARAGAGKRRCAGYALSRAIVCPVKAAGFDGISIPGFLNRSMFANIGRSHIQEESMSRISCPAQFISQGLRDTSRRQHGKLCIAL